MLGACNMSYKISVTIILSLFCTQSLATDCEKCERLNCPVVEFCPSGVSMDSCSCCEVCAQGMGKSCDFVPEGETTEKSVNGTCGEFLECSEAGICECSEEGAVCGSDDVTYNSICEFMEATNENHELTVVDRMPCRKGPFIKSPPKDAARPPGSILVLDCEVTGYPVPVISWELHRSDGSTVQLPNDDPLIAIQVRGGPEEKMVTGWVQIMKILPENVGIYTCRATNSNGEVKASAKVSFSKGKVPKKKQ